MSAGARDVAQERARLIAWALDDFRRFCGLLEIQPVGGGGRVPFRLTALQRRYCEARTPRDIILKPRQVYVTTLECARDLWIFLTRPGARVVVVCQSQTEHGAFKDISYKFRLFIDSLRRAGVRLEFGTEAAGEWTLPNRDATLRIIEAGASDAAAAKKGRGGTINRLHITEAAFFEHADVTFNALLESVPGPEHGSEIVNESTPNGASGFYFKQWRAAVEKRSGYTPHFFRWWDHPSYRLALDDGERIEPATPFEHSLVALGVSPEQLKWHRRKVAEKGADLTKQEFPSDPDTCFLVSGRTFFDAAVTSALLDKAREPIAIDENDALRIWASPLPGVEYVVGMDTSEGIADGPKPEDADYTAAVVLRRGTGEHVATLHGRWPTWEAARLVAALGRRYNTATVAVERNNHGHAVLQALSREQRYPRIYMHADGKLGWHTTQVTRPVMLDALEDAHRRGYFATPDRAIIGELRTFVVTDSGRPDATRGAHDDLVMASAIGWSVICQAGGQRRDLSNLPHR